MTEESFKPGDVVRLKSGGPAMTVNKMVDADMGNGVKAVLCVWFNNFESKFIYVNFYDYTLEKFDPSWNEPEDESEEGSGDEGLDC